MDRSLDEVNRGKKEKKKEGMITVFNHVWGGKWRATFEEDRTTDELIPSKVHRGWPQATTCRLFTALMAAQFVRVAGDSTATDSRPTKDI